MDIRQLLLEAFEAEHREHLDAIRAALAAQASGASADWNDVFRRAHSLKGASRAVDLPDVEAVAHRLETLFERVSSGQAPLDRGSLGAVHLALDRIEAYVSDLKRGTAAMPGDAIAALDASLAGRIDKAVSAPQPQPEPKVQTNAPAPPAEPSEAAQDQRHTVLRVPTAAVHAVTDAAYGLANALPATVMLADGLARINSLAYDLNRRALSARTQRSGDQRAQRADIDEIASGLTALTRLTVELIRAEKAASATLEAASARVREEAQRLALVPAESAFGGFARTVRDMARELAIEVDIEIRGLDLPVDRATLQALRDPVLHALRNALSHGAESQETRRAAGKPTALQIFCEVAVRGSWLAISIHDDGRGVNLDTIAARARQRGLLKSDEDIGADRLCSLVFEPGFSTAESIDTLSGRGIGLSVVADAARKLHGSAQLRQRAPHGASLVIRVPLAASRRPILIVEAEGRTYGIPSAAVERLLHLNNSMLATAGGKPVAHLSGSDGTVALARAGLAAILGAPPSQRTGVLSGVLLRGRGGRCILEVERFSDVKMLLVLPPPSIGIDGDLVTGIVILGNDTPVLVLDADSLVDRIRNSGPTSKIDRVETHENVEGTMRTARRSTILVVDDSITTRTLEKSILEAAGYRVVVCVDGQDALDHLRSGTDAIDLVVADVEMPRLDGFGLVKALRGEAAFAELPVILMTSRGAADDVARGLELGADAYMTKQKFDQRELLETVGQLL